MTAYSIQVTETKNEGLTREFKVVVAASDITHQIGNRLQEVGKKVKLPGFRPGHVPKKVLEQRYKDSVAGEVLEQVINQTSQQVLSENSLRPALRPSIAIENYKHDEPLEYTMAMEVFPPVPVIGFDDITLERWSATPSDKEVDERLERVQKAHRRFDKVEDANHAAEKGNVTLIDFKGSVDGELFEGGSAEGFRLELGSGQFIPGFEDQLIGAKAGESRTVNVTFPENYGSKELAGKAASFAVDVKEILQANLPEANDEFAKEVGFEDLATLKSAIKEQIQKEYTELGRSKLKKELFDILDEKYPFEVPKSMLDLEFESLWKQVKEDRQGEFKDKSEEELKAEFTKMAERRVRLGILLAEAGRLNKLEVAPDELRRAIYDQARMYPGQERQVIEFYQKNRESLDQLKGPILEEKVVDFILQHVKIGNKDVSAKALTDYFEESQA